MKLSGYECKLQVQTKMSSGASCQFWERVLGSAMIDVSVGKKQRSRFLHLAVSMFTNFHPTELPMGGRLKYHWCVVIDFSEKNGV